jgi:diacylglycerol kinase (ATP)
MTKRTSTGLRRVINATFFSLAGLRAAWHDEAAFRQELVLSIALVPAALWLGRTAAERALLIGSCFIVLIVELLNTALENAVDRIGREPHPLAGRAKDLGSAAVFVSLALVVATWSLVAWARFGARP